jgi:hypothetical protein
MDFINNAIVLLGIFRPMDEDAVCRCVSLELFQVVWQIRQSVLLDRGGKRAHLLPLRNGVNLHIPRTAQLPQPAVVEFDVLLVCDELPRVPNVIHALHADAPFRISAM